MEAVQNSPQHFYETTVIINAALEDPQVEALITRIQDLIARANGSLESINRWGRKRLTYPIKKKNNGFYVHVEFRAPGTIVKALEHAYLLDEQILRFLTIKLDKKALKARELGVRAFAAQAETAAAAQPVAAVVAPAEEPKSDAKAPLFAEEPAA